LVNLQEIIISFVTQVKNKNEMFHYFMRLDLYNNA